MAGDLIYLRGVLDVRYDYGGVGGVDTVLDVLGGAHSGSGHRQDPELDHSEKRDVPLGVAWEHEEGTVAFLNTLGPEDVGEPVGLHFQVPEGVVLGGFAVGIDGQEGELGAVLGPLVDHVEGEVVELRHVQSKGGICLFIVLHVHGGFGHEIPPSSVD